MFSRATPSTHLSAFGLNWTDHGARMYDASIGRWNAVDPLADNFAAATPYNYCFGDPVNLTDKNGMAPGGEDDPWWMHHREQYSPWRSSSTFTSWEGVAVGHGWARKVEEYEYGVFDNRFATVAEMTLFLWNRGGGLLTNNGDGTFGYHASGTYRPGYITTTTETYDKNADGTDTYDQWYDDVKKYGPAFRWRWKEGKSWLKATFVIVHEYTPGEILYYRARQLFTDPIAWGQRNLDEVTDFAVGVGAAAGGAGLAALGYGLTGVGKAVDGLSAGYDLLGRIFDGVKLSESTAKGAHNLVNYNSNWSKSDAIRAVEKVTGQSFRLTDSGALRIEHKGGWQFTIIGNSQSTGGPSLYIKHDSIDSQLKIRLTP